MKSNAGIFSYQNLNQDATATVTIPNGKGSKIILHVAPRSASVEGEVQFTETAHYSAISYQTLGKPETKAFEGYIVPVRVDYGPHNSSYFYTVFFKEDSSSNYKWERLDTRTKVFVTVNGEKHSLPVPSGVVHLEDWSNQKEQTDYIYLGIQRVDNGNEPDVWDYVNSWFKDIPLPAALGGGFPDSTLQPAKEVPASGLQPTTVPASTLQPTTVPASSLQPATVPASSLQPQAGSSNTAMIIGIVVAVVIVIAGIVVAVIGWMRAHRAMANDTASLDSIQIQEVEAE